MPQTLVSKGRPRTEPASMLQDTEMNNNSNSVALIRERTMPTERPPLVGEVVPTFADRVC
jgi:hypothetical protein